SARPSFPTRRSSDLVWTPSVNPPRRRCCIKNSALPWMRWSKRLTAWPDALRSGVLPRSFLPVAISFLPFSVPAPVTPMLKKHQLELLSPARDVSIAKEAILHGADAVYIGGPGFGARHNASNSVADIAQLVEFAHVFHAKVFVTLNTILHDDELEPARRLIHELYDAGVDALIVQDMGVLELDIPPIELHASTQCDIRRLEKAQFLSQAGFSQIVLARELNLQEIKAIADSVDAAVEFFIHGALCVAFSGQCNISHAQTGRSANRGDCSQACRLPYTLKDDAGRVVAYDKHLLSMKDNNQSANLRDLVDAGVRSFKIEGRYKDVSY